VSHTTVAMVTIDVTPGFAVINNGITHGLP